MAPALGDGEPVPNDGHDSPMELLLAFDTDDEQFVRGVNVGMIWTRLDLEGYFDGLVHGTNAEMVMRMADAKGLGFSAEDLEGDWFHVVIR